MTDLQTVGSIDKPWRSWLGGWQDVVDPDLPVVFYKHDGTDSPDEWVDGPHLAIALDLTIDGEPRAVVWPVRVDGWADPSVIGWDAVLGVLAAGRREVS